MGRAQTDGQVEAFFDKVDVAVGHADFDLHFGVSRGKLRQQREQAVVGIGGGRADAQHAAGHALMARQHATGLRDLRQRLFALLEVNAAVVGQANLPRAAHKQPYAQARLQPSHRAADRRRGDAQGTGSRGEAVQLGRFAKQLDAAELHGIEASQHALTLLRPRMRRVIDLAQVSKI